MKRLKLYLLEFRYSHWIKNLILFMPLFFGGKIINVDLLRNAILGFIAFSWTASFVYVFNDLKDIEEDKKHPKKKSRPIASGEISQKEASMLLITLSMLISLLTIYIDNLAFTSTLFAYLLINLLYSFSLKKVPVIELIIVTTCYILRLLAGGAITNISVSYWLLIVIFFGALLFISGKRLTEKRNSKTRSVLKKYRTDTLKNLTYFAAIASTLCMVIYTITQGALYIPQAVIYALAIIRYVKLLHTTDKGESTEIFIDRSLIFLIVLFSIYSFFIIYYKGHLL